MRISRRMRRSRSMRISRSRRRSMSRSRARSESITKNGKLRRIIHVSIRRSRRKRISSKSTL